MEAQQRQSESDCDVCCLNKKKSARCSSMHRVSVVFYTNWELRPFMVMRMTASLSSKLYDLAGRQLSGMLDGTCHIKMTCSRQNENANDDRYFDD